MPQEQIIGIVGPCAAGKTTLIANLARQGITARHIAQEHSFVPDMWRRIDHPDALIYLDVSYVVSMQRRPTNLNEDEFKEMQRRLENARLSADLYIHTDSLTPLEVLGEVLDFLSPPGG